MVKAKNNPQGFRVLINELVGGLCLDWLDVRHPAPAIVELPEDILANSPDAKFDTGEMLAPGLGFGSELWQSDAAEAIPASDIRNKGDVAGTNAFDSWVVQGNGRQARVRAAPDEPGKYDYFPVDQGHSFGAPEWTPASLDGARDVNVSSVRPIDHR